MYSIVSAKTRFNLSGNMGRVTKDQLSAVGKNHQIRHLESADRRNARCPKQWKERRSGLLDGRYERRLSRRKSENVLLQK